MGGGALRSGCWRCTVVPQSSRLAVLRCDGHRVATGSSAARAAVGTYCQVRRMPRRPLGARDFAQRLPPTRWWVLPSKGRRGLVGAGGQQSDGESSRWRANERAGGRVRRHLKGTASSFQLREKQTRNRAALRRPTMIMIMIIIVIQAYKSESGGGGSSVGERSNAIFSFSWAQRLQSVDCHHVKGVGEERGGGW